MKEVSFHGFLREGMWTSSDVMWRPGVELPILPHSINQQNRKHSAKLRSRSRKSVAVILYPWLGKRTRKIFVHASLSDKSKTVKNWYNDSLVSKLFLNDCVNPSIGRKSCVSKTYSLRDQVVEEPWLSHSLTFHHFTDTGISSKIDYKGANYLNQFQFNEDSDHTSEFDVNDKDNNGEFNGSLLSDHPVEEPWMFDSCSCSGRSSVEIVSDASENECSKDEDTLLALGEQHLVLENLLHEESNAVTEDFPFTVILINSSLCTMQRIAVLENDKLVELLLEPIKNNVQCDSVYVGIVTKLVPHMGGAFVNIGSPRPAFMDIKIYREPFVLPPIHGRELEGSMIDKLADHVHFPENTTFFDGAGELDEVENDKNEDEFVDDDYESHDNHFNFDAAEVIEENLNGSVSRHEREADPERFLEQLNGDVDQLQNNGIHLDSNNIHTEESKWVQVQEGSKIIVQVVKEGLGTKGPTLTAYPVLRSRFWILITRCNTIGISKKISGGERTRLRVIAKALQPPGFGLTIRTVAAGHPLEELQKDLEGLLLTWKNVMEHAKSAALAADEGVDGAVPVMLHRAMGQTLCVVQDYFNEKVKKMVVDSPRTYHEVTNYLQKIAPDLCDRVELYSKKTPLFDEYKIEGEINSILSKRVPLTNGGYLVIEQTEALVSIDVNGGHCMLGQGTSQEKAILEVNLAAAKQIARELRLRDVGGIIVVDFIDMMDDSNKRLIYEEVKNAVERDRSTVKVSELSRHGLMEITRKRVRPSVTFMISEPCTCCHATGRVEALETSFSKIEHEICRLLSIMDQKRDPENAKSWPRFILRVDRHMCNYLTSGKRTRLAILSSSLKVWILLKVARGLTRGTFELKHLTDHNVPENQHQAAISVLRPTEAATYASTKKVTLLPIKWKTGGK
ncbi:ribonuclease E/G-like protein, chloroplastic isoform X1 [Primulina eburnea]|uniref:ribonuclease E/G-like protein, chloroplastic isoform X1 n=1 Tax=Primulina eburnea TaxID=1245227 RepID=UPI003C6C1226